MNVNLQTNVSFMSVTLVPGYKYFTTVYCYNPLGMVELSFSDGFVVDLEPPSAGVVFTSLSHTDSRHQASTLTASWHGFTDSQSFVREYLYTVTEDNTTTDIVEFESSVLKTSVEIPLTAAHHGKKYQVHVIAVDAAGHESEMISSNYILVDHTPAVSVKCDHYEEEYFSTFSCICTPITDGHPFSSCRCSTSDQYQYKGNSLAVIEITTSRLLKSATRLEFGEYTQWVKVERLNHDLYRYQVFYIYHEDQIILPIIHVESELPAETFIKISSCEQPIRDNTKNPVHIKQIGRLGLLLDFAIYDTESAVSTLQVAIGTSAGGYQLLPFTEVGKQLSLFVSRTLQHMMEVRATIIAVNGAGRKSVFTSEPLVIDWTSPVISDIDVNIENTEDNLYSITATWVVVDEESQVTDCLWKIGNWWRFYLYHILKSSRRKQHMFL